MQRFTAVVYEEHGAMHHGIYDDVTKCIYPFGDSAAAHRERVAVWNASPTLIAAADAREFIGPLRDDVTNVHEI